MVDSLENVVVSGTLPLTTIDFPGRLAVVLFTQGCSWRCGYCQNPNLLAFRAKGSGIPFEKIRKFLEERRRFLDGVVFSGGEPTEQKGLADYMRAVKAMGYAVGLHTNGSSPETLGELMGLLDFIGMDIKAPFEKYESITMVPGSGESARKSAEAVIKSGVDHEFRLTYHPALLSCEDLIDSTAELARLGAKKFIIQAFRAKGCLDPALGKTVLAADFISSETQREIRKLISDFTVRF